MMTASSTTSSATSSSSQKHPHQKKAVSVEGVPPHARLVSGHAALQRMKRTWLKGPRRQHILTEMLANCEAMGPEAMGLTTRDVEELEPLQALAMAFHAARNHHATITDIDMALHYVFAKHEGRQVDLHMFVGDNVATNIQRSLIMFVGWTLAEVRTAKVKFSSKPQAAGGRSQQQAARSTTRAASASKKRRMHA
jgi:hypothetical protein